ncbi:FadR/GntR family transcriptional regulator [Streptomyces sulphureus]|uniref:FadR/GntR family transcriptional regulator n=1 Tax=Streptomyces sulphureus TaxID=47758 RepID=UPI0003682B75|nr:FadR/GntR family transcriptional regulator [Streptomyces sulphureus]
MPLRSTARTSLVEAVIEQIEALIAEGEWPVGAKVPPEPVLVEELGVGRNTVREAVRALTHTGMLEPRPGDGTYVRADSGFGAAVQRRLHRSTALEAYEVRASLERDAARYAAQRRTAEDVAALRAALTVRDDAWDAAGDNSAFVEADMAFHQAVAAAGGNSVLAELYDQFSDSLRTTLRSVTSAPLPDTVRRQVAEHTAIVDAIEARDPAAAEAAALAHLSAAMEALRELEAADIRTQQGK